MSDSAAEAVGEPASPGEHAGRELSTCSLLVGRPDAKLPATIYVRLIAKLCEGRPAVVASTVAGQGFIGGIAAWWTGDGWLAVLTLLTCVVTAALIPALLGCPPVKIESGQVSARAADRRFSLLSFGSSVGTGLMAARAVTATDDAVVHLMLVALGLSGVGIVLRNYVQPRLTLWQVVALIVPPAVAMAWRNEPLYWVIALSSTFLVFNMFKIATGLYRAARESFRKDEELYQQNLHFDTALSNMAQGLCMFDADRRLLVCNARYREIYGFSPEVVKPGLKLHDLLEHSVAVGNHPGHTAVELYDNFVTRFAAQAPASFHNQLGNGRTIAISHEPMPGGGWVATHEDITARIAAEARISYLARHDALTGLPNRVVLADELGEAASRAHRGEPVAVLCLDLDRFKSVNDTLGHAVGDALLKEVASRLQSCTRGSDTLARFGGDEFAIVQVGSAQPTGAALMAERIVEAISEPFEIAGHLISIGASIGVSVAPDDGCEADQLLRNADLALYRAKSDGRGRHRFFAPEMDEQMQARRRLELDLRRAIAAGEFELAFQPLVALPAGSIQGFEALLRWRHPTRGIVMPGEFIPLAEEIGLIVPIGEWVLREACATAATWPRAIRVAVNLSPAQFRSGDLVRTVVSALAVSGLEPVRLEVEITEGVLLTNCEATLTTLHSLRQLGVRIAMDDFGTGYSSLSYLRSFPFDKIKIDRSFVSDIADDDEAMAIVRAVTGLGRTLGIATTAEGIETEEQLAHVSLEGCSEAQGFLLGRPLSADGAAALLTEQCPSRAPVRRPTVRSAQALALSDQISLQVIGRR